MEEERNEMNEGGGELKGEVVVALVLGLKGR